MNENIDLTKILKDCPKGTKLYSIVYGDVMFERFRGGELYPILIRMDDSRTETFSADGKMYYGCGECSLFPSKDQRDWSKFSAYWLKKERFDPKTLKPFDRVLVRDRNTEHWRCCLFSHIIGENMPHTYQCIGCWYRFCIPYNDDTKHLVGTNEEAPEYYRYWED